MSLVLERVIRKVGPLVSIDDISLDLARGTLNVLLGPTLSGKTSLMRLMAGLDQPTAGRVIFNGVDVTRAPVRGRSVAMVYQQFINYPGLSVYENIASPLRVAKLDKAEIDRRVQEAAELLRLGGMLGRLPQELSGGQQQRTAIARALVKRADCVLMDEPLANLDYKLREELREELPRIFAKSGAVFVYATTEPSEALLLGGNTAVLKEGRLVQFGPTAEVYRRPSHIAAADVFSDPPMNHIRAEKSGGMLHFMGQVLPADGAFSHLPDGAFTLAFRAHHLRFAKPGASAIALSGTVAVCEITGSESFVHIEAAPHRFIALARGLRHDAPGARVDAWIDPDDLYAFDAAGQLALAPQHGKG